MIKTALFFNDRELSERISDALASAHAGILPVFSCEDTFDIAVTDDIQYAPGNNRNYVVVNTPLRTTELIGSIVDKYAEVYGKVPLLPKVSKKEVKTVLFCASSGGCGSTSVAIGLCRELQRYRGKEVCYFNLESIGGEGKYFTDGHAGRFSYFMEKTGYTQAIPDAFFLADVFGVKAVPTGGGLNEFLFQEEGDFSRVINLVCANDFDYVIFDAGQVINNNILNLIKSVDHLCFVEREGNNEKTERWFSFFSRELAYIRSKTLKIINFTQNDEISSGESGLESGKTEQVVLLERDDNSFENDLCIDGAFGIGIKEIANLLSFYNKVVVK